MRLKSSGGCCQTWLATPKFSETYQKCFKLFEGCLEIKGCSEALKVVFSYFHNFILKVATCITERILFNHIAIFFYD